MLGPFLRILRSAGLYRKLSDFARKIYPGDQYLGASHNRVCQCNQPRRQHYRKSFYEQDPLRREWRYSGQLHLKIQETVLD